MTGITIKETTKPFWLGDIETSVISIHLAKNEVYGCHYREDDPPREVLSWLSRLETIEAMDSYAKFITRPSLKRIAR